MIINVALKSQLSSIIARSVDTIFCIENGVTYQVSPIDNRPIVDNNLPVITSVQSTAPTTTSYSEVGTVRINSTTNDIYICTDNTNPQNVIWKNITQELNHTKFNNKDDTYDGGHTYLVPRIVSSSNPTSTNYNYKIGTVWINTSTDTIFVIVDNTENNAIWNEYNKKYQVVSDTITLNNENMNTKTILLSNVNSNNIFTFQFTGNIQEYIIVDIKLSVIEIVENTSVTVMAFTPNRYNGNVEFKIIIN